MNITLTVILILTLLSTALIFKGGEHNETDYQDMER